MTNSLKSSFRSGLSFISLGYLLVLILFWLSPFWPKPLWWLINFILAGPLWILGLPLVFLVVGSSYLREYRVLVINIVSLGILLFGIMGFKVSFIEGRSRPGHLVLRIVTSNLGQVGNIGRLSKYLQSVKPDIIAFQETNGYTESYLTQIFPTSQWDCHFVGHLGLASRFKIASVETRDRHVLLGGWGAVVNKYVLEGPQGPIHFLNVHLETPRKGIEPLIHRQSDGISEMKSVTELQIKESMVASSWASEQPGVIVAGDFNLSETNPIYARYWSKFNNAFSQSGRGFNWTKYLRRYRAGIDHILFDKHWRVLRSKIGPPIGSDHRPLLADIEFSGKE